MDLHIRNYRRIAQADIEIGNGVTLVCGRNDQGKTSIAEAARAVLTGQAIVAAGDAESKRTQKTAKALVHDGAETGAASIVTQDGSAAIKWPDCDYQTKGAAVPHASDVAAGVTGADLPSLSPVDRLKVLRGVLGGEPTFADLKRFFAEDKIVSEKLMQRVWEKIETDGWESTFRYARDKGAEFKGMYREITGQTWGVRKSAGWAPEGWDLTWEGQSIDTFKAALEAARERLEELVGASAVSKARIDELKQSAATLEAATADLDEKVRERDKLAAEITEKRAELDAVEKPRAVAEVTCPHCNGELWIVNKEFDATTMKSRPGLQIPPEDMNRDATKELDHKWTKLDGELGNLKGRHGKADAAARNAETAVQAAEAAARELAEMGDAPEQADEKKIAEARGRVETAEVQLRMVDMKLRADALHAQIVANQRVCEALDEGGVRATVLGAQVEIFNKTLRSFSSIAGLGEISMAPDGRVDYGGIAFRDLSGSGQLRARAVLQAAVALHDKSAAIVIDIDEATDKRHVAELCQMLSNPHLPPALVCVHVDREADAPDLSQWEKQGVQGRSYVVADGQTRRVGETDKEQAA